ncbi:MAG: LacI family DNA-binding transcriptional regulator [Bacteroidales bacterium]
MIPKEKITIYDLAKQLNTTASTVSRALKDHPRISKKMKQAVNELAEKLNYQPDPIAHHLRTGKGLVIGVIVPRIDRHFFASVIGGIQSVAQENGYSVIISQSNESYEKEVEAVKAMANKKIDGLAISIAAQTADYRHFQQLMDRGIPVVFFDRIPDMPNIDCVVDNNYKIGYEAVKHLHKQGCRKIAHYAGPQSLLEYRNRLAGYKQAIEDLGLEYKEEYVVYDSITMDTGITATQYVLSLEDRPDAIFSAGDYSAITAMDTIKKHGLAIPEDIAVIGIANEPFVNYLEPALSSFDLHNRKLGEEAAAMLIDRMNKDTNHRTGEKLVFEAELIERASSLKKQK